MAKLPDPSQSGNPEAIKQLHQLEQKRGSIGDMYRSMLNHPDLLKRVSALGGYLRYEATLPSDIREFTILAVARHFEVAYEWMKHQEPAKLAQLPAEVIQSIYTQQELPSQYSNYRLVAQTIDTVLARKSIPETLQNKIEQLVGITGLIEIVILVGFYEMISNVVSSFDVSLPNTPNDLFK